MFMVFILSQKQGKEKGAGQSRRNCCYFLIIYKNSEEEGKMNIKKTREGNTMTIALEGRLDTTTAPVLEEELKKEISGVEELYFDFQALDYISSAGLRVLLSAQKTMNKQGKMVIKNANEDVMEIFEVTGFVDILSIEE